jgi:hypothetical protein
VAAAVRCWYRQGSSVGPSSTTRCCRAATGWPLVAERVRQQLNDVLSAETAMMVKERFVESYGAPRYTIG